MKADSPHRPAVDELRLGLQHVPEVFDELDQSTWGLVLSALFAAQPFGKGLGVEFLCASDVAHDFCFGIEKAAPLDAGTAFSDHLQGEANDDATKDIDAGPVPYSSAVFQGRH